MYLAISLGTDSPLPRCMIRSAPKLMKLRTRSGLMSAQLWQKPHASVHECAACPPPDVVSINWEMRSATRRRSASDNSLKAVSIDGCFDSGCPDALLTPAAPGSGGGFGFAPPLRKC